MSEVVRMECGALEPGQVTLANEVQFSGIGMSSNHKWWVY